jgi:methionyl-tRNA formyltransferase
MSSKRRPVPSLRSRGRPLSTSERYVVVGCKPWNRRIFNEQLRGLPGTWTYVSIRDELSVEALKRWNPKYVFFLHWSWKVPNEIIQSFECVCFHMTDLPYGRGGSPLQNLIARGHRETKMTALRMVEEFDAGPVYLKAPLSLEGNAEQILIRASELSADMIKTIVRKQPTPRPQKGKPAVFKRRTPDQSAIEAQKSLGGLYDFIRMLDAEGYPKAFIQHGDYRYEFGRASLYDGKIVADVVITPIVTRDAEKIS